MSQVEIYRYRRSLTETSGLLLVNGTYACDTLELPWKGNLSNISCIENGIYQIQYSEAHSIVPAFEVIGVQGRSGILIHRGNTTRDTSGCILVGHRLEFSFVEQSVMAFNLLLSLVGKGLTDLIIKDIS